jgi:hypothetical protein
VAEAPAARLAGSAAGNEAAHVCCCLRCVADVTETLRPHVLAAVGAACADAVQQVTQCLLAQPLCLVAPVWLLAAECTPS